jgi:hypothetical protein
LRVERLELLAAAMVAQAMQAEGLALVAEAVAQTI